MAAPQIGRRQSAEKSRYIRLEQALQRNRAGRRNQLARGQQAIKALSSVYVHKVGIAFPHERGRSLEISLAAAKERLESALAEHEIIDPVFFELIVGHSGVRRHHIQIDI